MSGGTITNNMATTSGGGIYNFIGTLTLEESVSIIDNTANNEGGGLYLHGAPTLDSTTTLNNVIVSSNRTNGNQKTTGWGVYWENGAIVNGLPGGLTDDDDPSGKPYQGP